MDQLRVILQHVKKHHFWLLCVLCLVAGVLGWKMAAGSLSAEFDRRKGEIDGKFSALTTIESEPNFPNAKWKAEVQKLTDLENQKVRTAWKQVYDSQGGLLIWPDYLGPDFLAKIKTLQQGTEIEPTFRDRYMTQIRNEFPKLLEIIGAESYEAEKSTDPAGARRDGAPRVVDDRVVWVNGSQQSIHDKLKFTTRPSAMDVWLTQEDLWVYQSLLAVIKNVNTGRIVPPIKEINELLIAQRAAERFAAGMVSGKVERPKAAGSVDSGEDPGNAAAVESADATGGEGEAPASDQGRYLDANGKPAAAVPGQPFKRMPIYLKLRIDQREIAKLLVECANSPLPIEVRQLRINPGAGGRAQQVAGNTGAAGAERGTYDVPIELCGIIYIYNPPPDEVKPAAEPAAAGG